MCAGVAEEGEGREEFWNVGGADVVELGAEDVETGGRFGDRVRRLETIEDEGGKRCIDVAVAEEGLSADAEVTAIAPVLETADGDAKGARGLGPAEAGDRSNGPLADTLAHTGEGFALRFGSHLRPALATLEACMRARCVLTKRGPMMPR